MNFSVFIVASLFFALGCNLVVASPANRFDPDQEGNLIGVIILSAVALCLLCLFVMHQIHEHHVGIKAWFRLRNPSLRALAPRSRLFNAQGDGDQPVQLEDLSNDDGRSMSLRGFLNSTASDGSESPEVHHRPPLIGLGIINGHGDEAIAPPPRAVLAGGRVSYGPPPTPPPRAPLPPPPPARDARRRVPYLPAAVEDEEAGPSGTSGSAGF